MQIEFDNNELRRFLEGVMEIEEKYAFAKQSQNTRRLEELQKLLDKMFGEVK